MKIRKFVLIPIFLLLLIVVAYMCCYPIRYESVEVSHILKENFGTDDTATAIIQLNNKDSYHYIESGDNIVIIKMQRGVFGRSKYNGLSYTDTNFVNGVIENNGNKYLLVGGKNPNNLIAKISFTLDNIPYEIDLANTGDSFFTYLQIDKKTVDDHIFLDNTILYNAFGEDITATLDTSSGGI
ncbi:hypothetical protein [Anaerotignum sp.]|uniref:hypothetical protein n=1 Tax=Anaerotignum sp. TaxID=2039241 RepID=UPI0028B24A49|nr:hypothetical protein [Anaerotignum sp.]